MSRQAELGLALLLVVALLVAFLAGRRRSVAVPAWEPPSTYRTGPMGARAAYDVLARLGIPVERRRTSLFDLVRAGRRPPAVLLVVEPERWLVPGEREAVARYVDGGGALVAAGDAGGLTGCFGWEPERPDSAERGADSVPVRLPPGFEGETLPRVGAVLHARGEEADSLEGRIKRAAELRKRRALARLVRDEGACTAVQRVGVDTLLSTVRGGPVLVRLRFRGGGRVLLVSEPGYFRNAAWRTTDVPELLVSLIVPERRGRVSWDEYHHGYGDRGSLPRAVLGWMVRSPIGWLLFQLVAVGLVWLAMLAVRFGPPRPVLDRRRRSPLEHVEALAAGLEGAAGVEAAVALTVAGLRRRLSRTGQPPPARGDVRQWLAALELALPGARGRRAARRLRHILTQPGGAERVLGAAQAVEDVWEELRPRAMPARSWTR
jgi:hypothetical protein